MDILWRIYPASSPPAKLRVVAVRPLTDRAVHFEAIDEIDAYYRAATSNLDVAIPRRRPPEPRVIAATFAEVPVRIGTAGAVELTISLATAGDWRGAGAFHAPVAEAIWDDAAARQAVVDTPRGDDTVTLYRNDGTWAETRVWDGVAWRPAPRRHDGTVLADQTVHGDAIAPRSVTADKPSVQDLSAITAELGTITVDRAHITDGAIDSAKFADAIQNDHFEPGQRGWRIQRDGRAEFNNPVLSRQLQVDSSSLDLRAIRVRRTTGPAIAASWIVETARSIDAWDGARWTYLATAGLDNTSVESEDGDPTDALFGVQATALALTRRGGGQRLRLKLDLWTQKVIAVRPKSGET